MAEGNWGTYLSLLGTLTGTIEELTGVEQTKTQAVIKGDRAGVEQCMKQEQILSLKLRGLDKKRDALLEQLGMKGVPLKEIMDHCPSGAEEETREAAEALRRQYGLFQAASEVARNTLECNLHAIEKIMKLHNGGMPVQHDPSGQTNFMA